MKIKRILLTGDDGYTSIGTRILVHYLKDRYDLSIAATLGQMSAVGGHVSLKNGGTWGVDTVDGVRALWVSGYPCDAVECAVGFFKKPFDLVISGINLGMNVGEEIISSGTYSAAIRVMALALAPRAMVMSWMCPPEFWTLNHNGDEDIAKFIHYPGESAKKVFQLSLENDMWGASILNINFPAYKTEKIRFTRGVPDLKLFFNYPIPMDPVKKTYTFPNIPFNDVTKGQLDLDTGALLAGYISISPHRIANLDDVVYGKMKNTELNI